MDVQPTRPPQPGGFDGLVHVRFAPDRESMRRMQRALAAAAHQLRDAAFQGLAVALVPPARPANCQGSPAASLPEAQRLQPTTGAVAETSASMRECGKQPLNPEQRAAVAAVVCGAGRAAPFTLFGPPGEAGALASLAG